MPQSSCLSLTYVVPDSAHEPQEGAIALVLTARLFAGRCLHNIASLLDKEVWPVMQGNKPSVPVERGCWEAVVSDASTSSEFLYVIPVRVS